MIFDVNVWLGVWPFRSLRDNTAETLISRLDRAGIDMAAVSQIEAVFHRNTQPANERLAESLSGCTDRLLPMASINPMFPDWEQDLRVCHETLGMRGVRIFPQYHDYPADGADARAVVSACAERDLPVTIHHRIEDVRQRHWMDPGRMVDLTQVANLISAVPEATIIVSNARGINTSPICNNEDIRGGRWYFDLSLAEVHYCLHHSIDAMTDLAAFIEQGGADHLVFGSHLPFSYVGPALVKRAILPVDPDTLEDICWNRAAAMFGVAQRYEGG